MFLLNDFSKINSIFEAYPLENIEVIGRLKNLKSAKVWVDDLEKPNAFWYEDEEWSAPFGMTESQIQSIVREMSKKSILEFCGIPMYIAKVALQTLKQKGYEVDWEEHCALYYLPVSAYDQYKTNDSMALGPILETDLETVNHYYTYKGEGSLEYLRECIRQNPSSMMRDEKGNPISWALVREDGSMGVMFTVKEYRKKGLAKEVSKDLIQKVVGIGQTPYVHIVIDNHPSIALAKELGMVKWGDVLWFGMKNIEGVSND